MFYAQRTAVSSTLIKCGCSTETMSITIQRVHVPATSFADALCLLDEKPSLLFPDLASSKDGPDQVVASVACNRRKTTETKSVSFRVSAKKQSFEQTYQQSET